MGNDLDGEYMKKICFSIPCFNEEKNIKPMVEDIMQIFNAKELIKYDYSIEFIDNKSTDGTRKIIKEMCVLYPNHVKAIFNSRNFGGVSNYYGILQTNGDCTIVLPCDFQIPLKIIPELIEKWEQGSRVVCAIKSNSKENKVMWKIRSFYYQLIKKFSNIEQIDHFTGAGLYDSCFVQWLRTLNDPIPSLRGMVVEYGCNISKVYYSEEKRKTGKSKQTFLSLFAVAITNMITYTRLLPHVATFLGLIISSISVLISIIYIILKLIYWNSFSGGIVPILFGVFFIGGVQLAFIGFLGEYLMIINQRLLNRPLVIEEERLNFEEDEEKQ